jgi:hypothetical protein
VASGADLLEVGRMVMDFDPVAEEHGFERKDFSVKDDGAKQTVTVRLFRDLEGGVQTKLDLDKEDE